MASEVIKGGAVVGGSLKAPASKSYAQRAVAAALLAGGESRLANMDLSNDTAAALDVAARLGAVIDDRGNGTYTIRGGLSPLSEEIDIGESGLSARMFTPIASLCDRKMVISGHGSILKRPFDMVVEPLRALGVKVETAGGLLPVTVHGPLRGGKARIDGSLSSQFLTGLLMALPMAEGDSVLQVDNPTSIPYIDMTLRLLGDFGIEVDHDDHRSFRIRGGQRYRAVDYNVEGDWSGASCLLVAGAVAGSVEVTNLNPDSLQADMAIMDALGSAGADICVTNGGITVRKAPLHAFEFDATQCPDLFPALAALAACCEGTSVIKGTGRLTHKESDRAATIASEFGKTGIAVDIETPDVMKITGGSICGTTVSSHNDHRIAMAMAVAALVCDTGMTIEDSGAVAKSYPLFWDDLRSIIKY